jgi:hypothetical protein
MLAVEDDVGSLGAIRLPMVPSTNPGQARPNHHDSKLLNRHAMLLLLDPPLWGDLIDRSTSAQNRPCPIAVTLPDEPMMDAELQMDELA